MKQVFTLFFIVSGLTVFSQQKAATKPAASKPAVTETQQAPAARPAARAQQPSAAVPATAAQTARTETQNATDNSRTAATSAQSRSYQPAPLPYNVDDKYMGRKDEFLNDMTVSEMPSDFPVYEKQWSLKEYNQVVDAYFINHQDILKARVKEKVSSMQH